TDVSRAAFDRQAAHGVENDMGGPAKATNHKRVAQLVDQNRAEKSHEPNQQMNSGVLSTVESQEEADKPEQRMNPDRKTEHLEVQIPWRLRRFSNEHSQPPS